jgi:GNAT superfamily N-acetyltransferase
VIGCYRLSSFQVEAGHASRRLSSRRAPVPAIMVSRLGVDTRWQHQGLGTALTLDALRFAANASQILNAALLVANAESDPAMAFCARFGLEPFRGEAGWLYLRLRDVEETLSSADPRPRGASRSG